MRKVAASRDSCRSRRTRRARISSPATECTWRQLFSRVRPSGAHCGVITQLPYEKAVLAVSTQRVDGSLCNEVIRKTYANSATYSTNVHRARSCSALRSGLVESYLLGEALELGIAATLLFELLAAASLGVRCSQSLRAPLLVLNATATCRYVVTRLCITAYGYIRRELLAYSRLATCAHLNVVNASLRRSRCVCSVVRRRTSSAYACMPRLRSLYSLVSASLRVLICARISAI